MNARPLVKGDVVQLGPACSNPMLAFCMMTVEEARPWGAIGYVQGTGQDGKSGGQAYYRAQWDEMEYVGKAEWVTE